MLRFRTRRRLPSRLGRVGAAFVVLLGFAATGLAGGPEEELWAAARNGDAKAVEALLAKGVDVNAKTSFGASALWFAAYKNQPGVVAVLLKKGADPNVRDRVWGAKPLDSAVNADGVEVLTALLEAGANGADDALVGAAAGGKAAHVRVLLDKGKVPAEAKAAALAAVPAKAPDVADLLRKAGAKQLPPSPAVPPEKLGELAGSYESQQGHSVTVAAKDGLLVTNSRLGVIVFKPVNADKFVAIAAGDVTLTLRRQEGKRTGLALRHGQDEYVCERSEDIHLPTPAGPRVPEVRLAVASPRDWPSFRGPGATGVADGQHPPTVWDGDKGVNLRWKTPIPGVAHSSPIVCGNRVFLTTAVSGNAKAVFKTGQYGAGTPSKDFSEHSWRVYCLDKATGKVLWEREVHRGVPRVDRHEKASQASATPATDGKHLAVVCGSEGLFCYDLDGKPLWRQDLGVLDLGAFNDPELKWGAGSSPILYRGMVIVQCDRPKDGFVAAFDADTGKPVWRTPRDEPPSWGTPTVVESAGGAELVANGSHFIRGYDAMTGKELWRLGPNSEITVPTPFAATGLIFVTNGYRPIQPIYAVVPGASGDISPKEGSAPASALAWEATKGGPYLPTPIVYGPNLYVCTNQGILTAYDARTGRQVYKRRLGGGGGYTASPVAADGRLYFTSEDGEVRVVKAGADFELLANNPVGEACLATPAIADGLFLVRSRGHLYAFGGRDPSPTVKAR
jgi:outer membrane protein assembly factor BamB